MKQILTLLCAFLLTGLLFAQPPEKMSYQAVVRDAGNALVVNSPVGMRISVLQTTATGTAVYVETHTPLTNANGLVSLEVGMGIAVSGTFSGIDWAAGPYFIKTETDPLGGTAYTITGTSELLSVPYALYAERANVPGVPGPQGDPGPPGVDGTDGAPGLPGADGTDGAPGLPGADGTDGAPGPPGADGTDGPPGADGTDGAPGPPGADGTDGAPGPQGDQGLPGVDGSLPPGTTAGEMTYWNGNAWVNVSPGTTDQTLTYCDGVPTWGPCPTCSDGIQNQGEADVDCGGPCPACVTCSDGIQNQGEADVDCGGPCPACVTCSDGIQNQGEADVDCGGPCPACPTCSDGIQNQGEADVDCGGPCPACITCSDGILNQGEEDADCGGPCPACPQCSSIQIGDTYAGGLVFYLAAPGEDLNGDGVADCGLVAAPIDQDYLGDLTRRWGCLNFDSPAPNVMSEPPSGPGSEIGDGQSNTTTIVTSCNVAGDAARICDELDLNGYDDWFLPSIGEMDLMYTNLHLNGVGGFYLNSSYWSSSEYNIYNAWILWFGLESQGANSKNGNKRVRAVRAF